MSIQSNLRCCTTYRPTFSATLLRAFVDIDEGDTGDFVDLVYRFQPLVVDFI